MDDAVEKMAEAICKTNPVTIDGRPLDWDELAEFHPDRAAEYREAAANRIRAEEAMRQLDTKTAKGPALASISAASHEPPHPRSASDRD